MYVGHIRRLWSIRHLRQNPLGSCSSYARLCTEVDLVVDLDVLRDLLIEVSLDLLLDWDVGCCEV